MTTVEMLKIIYDYSYNYYKRCRNSFDGNKSKIDLTCTDDEQNILNDKMNHLIHDMGRVA